MQYILCPRCKFKIAVNRHICNTCGFDLAELRARAAVNDGLGSKTKAQKNGFWQKFLGIEPPPEDTKDPGKEEPALS